MEKLIVIRLVEDKNAFDAGLNNPAGLYPEGKIDIDFIDHFIQTLRRRLNLDSHQRWIGTLGWVFEGEIDSKVRVDDYIGC